MDQSLPVQDAVVRRLMSSRTVAWLALALALLVLGFTVAFGTLHLRRHLREHVVSRDGEILYTVALARQYANGSGSNLTRRIGIPADQLALALDISQLREGTLAVRLFDAEGRFVTAVPHDVNSGSLAPAQLEALQQLQPVSQFRERARLSDEFLIAGSSVAVNETLPLLEVNIPLHARGQTELLGVAQMLVDGRPLAREYAGMDEHLWWLALGLYLAGTVLLSGVLGWAYQRLRHANDQLADRTARLLRANHQLVLAAKTSALGSVTAHLIHGLSNPLANLQSYMSAHGGNGRISELQPIANATRRMQQLVQEVLRVLGEEREGDRYELTVAELAGVLRGKLQPSADTAGVQLDIEVNASASLDNRSANLTLLILENLVHNSLKVTPPGRRVRVSIRPAGDGKITCEVADEGPGLSADLLPNLFTPCRSTHGGSGLGLAISKQLASQLGAELRIESTSPTGCVFRLVLPGALLASPGAAVIPPPHQN